MVTAISPAAAAEDLTISTPDELAALRDAVNGGNDYAGVTVTLAADIDLGGLNDYGDGVEEKQWIPIGNSIRAPFAGVFNGGGHTIKGLYVGGLFGYSSGTIQNLNVVGSLIEGSSRGGIAGRNSGGSIVNCCFMGSIEGGSQVGGIVGWNDGMVKGCSNNAAVSASVSVGGIAGRNDGTILNCSNTGMVSGLRNDSISVGGVVGENYEGTVLECYNTGDVFGGFEVGGVVGKNSETVQDSYNIGDVTLNCDPGSPACVGGVVGKNNINTSVTNCYNTGMITGVEGVTIEEEDDDSYIGGGGSGSMHLGRSFNGGICGENAGTVTSCYYLAGTVDGGIGDSNVTGSDVAGSAEAIDAAAFAEQSSFIDWDFDTVWMMDEQLARPILCALSEKIDDTENDTLSISTLEELAALRDAVNGGNDYAGVTVTLAADIDLGGLNEYEEGVEEKQWIPIGNQETPFAGTFDGGGHTISGLYFSRNYVDVYMGLFGYSTGTIQNMCVTGKIELGFRYVGGVVGQNDGTVANCQFSGDIEGASLVGGVAGYNTGRVINCRLTGENSNIITGYSYIGGVVGQNAGTVAGCQNAGTVTGVDSGSEESVLVGGITGYNEAAGIIQNCSHIGTVSGNLTVGGVAGANEGTLKGCYHSGAVSGSEGVGGVVGRNENTVTSSWHSGSVSGIYCNFAGGVAGRHQSGTLSNCYNTGTVAAMYNTGGVVGYVDAAGIVENCYNTGVVTRSSGGTTGGSGVGRPPLGGLVTGGVVGWSEGVVSSCYYMEDTAKVGIGSEGLAGSDVAGSAEVRSAAAFADPSSFAGWDLDTVWHMHDLLGRPVLTDNPEDMMEIGSLAELETFRDKVNGGEEYRGVTVLLTADIDLGGSEDNQWTPIGTWNALFLGTFDGKGHTVSGLYINKPYNGDYIGLFGYTKGTIQNLKVEGVVKGSVYVGGVAGKNEAPLTNCHFSGTVIGESSVGGIAGDNIRGTVSSCTHTGTVSGSNSVGGVVGRNHIRGTVTRCSHSGNVTGGSEDIAGGVVGWNDGTVSNSYNIGMVSGEEYVGGVAGRNFGDVVFSYNIGGVSGHQYVGGVTGINHGETSYSYNTGQVIGSGTVGGIVGENNTTVQECYNIGKVSGSQYVGSIAGISWGMDPLVAECYYLTGTAAGGVDGTDKERETTALSQEEFANPESFSYWAFELLWTMSDSLGRPVLLAIPERGAAEVITISTRSELEALRDRVNTGEDFYDVIIMLEADIDLEGGKDNPWTPIGTGEEQPFAGTFDGNGYRIKGLYIDQPGQKYQGLFGVNSGVIRNLNVEGSVSGAEDSGGIAGKNSGTVMDCCFSGSVHGNQKTGGIVGENFYGHVLYCSSDAVVGGDENTGGIAGEDFMGNIVGCIHNGTIGGQHDVGGIVGYTRGNVRCSYHSGSIVGGNAVGGVAGSSSNGNINECYNTGIVQGDTMVGGIVGINFSSRLKHCYNTGQITGNENVGGIAGEMQFGGMTDCYYLTGTAEGGIAGNDVEEQAEVLDAAAFAQQDSFEGWDFENVWKMEALLGRPVLKDIPESGIKIEAITTVYGTEKTQKLSAYLAEGYPQKHFTYTILDGNGTLGATVSGDSLKIPSTAPAGKYSLTVRAVEQSPQEDTSAVEVTFTLGVVVEKADPVVTPPKANTLTYTGNVQALVTAGVVTGGTMQYSLDGTNFSTTIPTASAADTYIVYYKVVGDSNHNDTEPQSVTVTISTAQTGGGIGGGGGGGGGGSRPSGGGGAAIVPTPTPTPANPEQTPGSQQQNEGQFIDVAPDAWYYAPIQYMAERQLMTGVSETEFAPDADVTRGMFVTVLYRMEKEPQVKAGSAFADVAPGAYYAQAVAWASEHGIVTGVSAEQFAPEENITREQMATVLCRYAGYKGQDTAAGGNVSFVDADSISGYAQDAVRWAAAQGILQGNADNTFAPAANATRAETAAVFQRLAEQLQERA